MHKLLCLVVLCLDHVRVRIVTYDQILILVAPILFGVFLFLLSLFGDAFV